MTFSIAYKLLKAIIFAGDATVCIFMLYLAKFADGVSAELKIVDYCFKANKLAVNIAKTKCMYFQEQE